MTTRDEIVKKISELRMVPPVVTQIINIIASPDFEMDKIAGTIGYDPSMTANILKTVNSPFMGLIDRIKTVKEAIVVVGSRTLLNLVLLTAAEMIAEEEFVEGYDISGEELWKSSVFTAIAAFKIAERKKLNNPNLFFTAGLLHDIGKIVMGRITGNRGGEIAEIAAKGNTGYIAAERQVMGVDHAELSGMVLECWKFPESLIDSVRYHHDPEKYGKTGPNIEYVAAVHLADSICMKSGVGTGRDAMNYSVSPAMMELLNIKGSDIEEIMMETLVEFRKIESEINSSQES
jgi:putative nucleotidyltransferase with HDIG domain